MDKDIDGVGVVRPIKSELFGFIKSQRWTEMTEYLFPDVKQGHGGG